jgi:hypothetical protein
MVGGSHVLPPKSMPTRGRIRKANQWVEVGSFTVDIVTKSVGRICKSSGVFPHQRHALTTLADIKLMLKDLDGQRDVARLSLIKSGKVKLLDAFLDYQKGHVQFIEAHINDPFQKLFTQWVTQGGLSQATQRNRLGVLKRLASLGLITPKTPVRELPEILRRMRAKYHGEGKAEAFNQARTHILVFLRHHLGYDEESHLFRRITGILRIKPTVKRKHHPLRTVHDLTDLLARINSSRGPNEKPEAPTNYQPWILFMTLTGIRPTEFNRGLWERDKTTGHLRIKGVKTANASRLVPHVVWLSPVARSPHALHQRLDALDPPTPVRSRDFRRTASIWFEEAGIPRSRLSYYLGHGTRDMTSLYQSRDPSKAELDDDARAIKAWLETQRQRPRATGDRIWNPRADELVQELLNGEVVKS